MRTFHQLLKILMMYAITAYINNTNMFISIRYHLALSATSGSYKSAGLPNITGHFGGVSNYAESGAFYTDTSISPLQGASSGGGATRVQISAKRSSSIYGNSTTVQPNSYTVKHIIKY